MQTLRSYKTPTIESIKVNLKVNNIEVTGSAEILFEEWHPDAVTTFELGFEANWNQIRAECSLGQESKIGLYMSAKSALTGVRELSKTVILDSNEGKLAFDVPGQVLGGKVAIKLFLVCLEAAQDSGPLAPGSFDQLLEWAWSAELEGGKKRGAVFEAKFPEQYQEAMWHIQVDQQSDSESWLYDSVNSRIRVFINKDLYHLERLENSWRINLVSDYIWELVRMAGKDLETLNFVYENADAGKGSLISTARNALLMIFGQMATTDISGLILDNPNYVRALIQSQAVFFSKGL